VSGRGPSVEVEGARQLRASLKRAGVGLDDLKAAHAEVAKMVADRATRDAPVRTGRLAASVRPSGTQREALVRAGRASVPYAGVIHWGWPSRGIPARPFIADAAEELRDSWEATYLRHVNDILDTIEGTPGP
jgi:hypothetical protein